MEADRVYRQMKTRDPALAQKTLEVWMMVTSNSHSNEGLAYSLGLAGYEATREKAVPGILLFKVVQSGYAVDCWDEGVISGAAAGN
jgi:hypothetical protein